MPARPADQVRLSGKGLDPLRELGDGGSESARARRGACMHMWMWMEEMCCDHDHDHDPMYMQFIYYHRWPRRVSSSYPPPRRLNETSIILLLIAPSLRLPLFALYSSTALHYYCLSFCLSFCLILSLISPPPPRSRASARRGSRGGSARTTIYSTSSMPPI